MKKTLPIILSGLVAFSLAGCSQKTEDPSESPAASSAQPASGPKYTVGICQLVKHVALDAATQGFTDYLKEEFGDEIDIIEQNAANETATCVTIVNQFITENVDLIMANATPALQAAAAATNSIPVLGTSITEYGVALDIDNFDGIVGTNVSGTSDLAPLGQQADMFSELLPDAENIGILYCSSEANSVYQADVVQAALEKAGKTVTVYKFSDSNDVANVTATACSENDALYIPTDNTAASCTEAINNVAFPAGVPIICGEEGLCTGCGIATLSISYYELGRATGNMAARILRGEEKISEMPVEYYQNPVKKYDKERCEALNITVPSDYEPIE